jgi:sigma-B regulation protein RsbU (phosphoserine phosphatase)
MTSDPASLSNDRLTLLYHLSQTFNSSLDLDEVLNRVMDEIIAATGAERGFVTLREPDGRLVFRTARGLDQRSIEEPQFHISRGVVEEVAREGQPVLTSDALHDDRFSERASIQGLRLRSILCTPLTLKDRVLGVVYVDNPFQAGIFTEADLEWISAISSSAAVAIENARLYQVAVEKGRLERELQVARQVQASLLPRTTPKVAGWEFAARWKPAREVSGDFYDFVPCGDQLGLIIADVSDKGMPAALFMALSRSIVRASATASPSPADAIHQANRLICADSADSMFVTLVYARLDPATGQVVYVNAGHNPPLLYSVEQSTLIELPSTGMALGVFEDVEFEERRVQLGPGDFILLYTDGVSEAMDPESRMFGEERLRRVLLDRPDAPAEALAAALEEALAAFTGPSARSDDVTFVVVRRLASAGEESHE